MLQDYLFTCMIWFVVHIIMAEDGEENPPMLGLLVTSLIWPIILVMAIRTYLFGRYTNHD